MSNLNDQLTRREAADRGELVPTTEDNLRIAAENREHDRRSIAIGLALPASRGWADTAAWVDEGTWLRILSEHHGEARAELERIRPPGRPVTTVHLPATA